MALLAALLFWKFDLIEIVLCGFVMDIAYGSNAIHTFGNGIGMAGHWPSWLPFLPFMYGAAVAVWVLSLIKKRIR